MLVPQEVLKMILTEEEAKALEKLLTCPVCRSKAVNILYKVRYYVKVCKDCGYRERLEIEWD